MEHDAWKKQIVSVLVSSLIISVQTIQEQESNLKYFGHF